MVEGWREGVELEGANAPALSGSLETLARIAAELGLGRIRAEAEALAARVAEGRFYLACVGQFKRGKSTLLNALIGEAVLPTGVTPVTAIPTIIRYGTPPSARVLFAHGEERTITLPEVQDFVTEERNPGNARQVEAVEVEIASPLLRSGICLVDTPGLGSVFEVATDATHAFLPQTDAALLVVGADPPVSADEAALAATVAREVPDVIVVLTKADRVDDLEREEAVRFTERVLAERLGRPVGPVLQVSAAERLNTGPTRDWHRLVETLNDLAARSGHRLVRSAQQRGGQRLATQLLARVEEQLRLLASPVEEIRRRLDLLHGSARRIEERLFYLRSMFSAEQERLAEVFQSRRNRFLEQAAPAALERIEEGIERLPGRFGLRRRAADLAREVAGDIVEPWLAQEERVAEEMYREVADRFVQMAQQFLEELSSSGETGLGALPRQLNAETGFHAERRFYFDSFPTYLVPAIPLRWLLDLLTPPRWLRRRIHRQVSEFANWLMDANSTRVQNDLTERLMESRRRLENEIRAILEEAQSWTEQAIARSEALHEAGAAAMAAEVERLETLEKDLRRLGNGLPASCEPVLG